MSNKTIKPLVLKPKTTQPTEPAPHYSEYKDINELEVPSAISEYLTSQGLAFRWINATKFRDKGGYHKNHWTPVKLDYVKLGMSDIHFGRDPSGLFRRGDMILATRPGEVHAQHKASLRMRAARLKASASKQGQDEMKQLANQLGGNSRVFSGYDEEEK